jgi:hypothetical protein
MFLFQSVVAIASTMAQKLFTTKACVAPDVAPVMADAIVRGTSTATGAEVTGADVTGRFMEGSVVMFAALPHPHAT